MSDTPIWEIERDEVGMASRMVMVGYRAENLPTSPTDAQMGIDWTPAARELAQAVRRRESKAQKILEELRRGPASTSTLARVGGVRFGARIAELRQAGHRIITEGRADYAIYRLEGK